MVRPIAVLGASGQIGMAVSVALRATGRSVRPLPRTEADIEDRNAVAHAISGSAAVVNAAAFTDVEAAETQSDRAHAVNAVGAGIVAAACAEARIPLLHYSTDYVFDGASDRAWREDDAARPLSQYGRSKVAGERAVAAAGPRHIILRTSWVFSAGNRNFVATMRRLANERRSISVVDDQIGGPTPADAIADASVIMIDAAMRRGFDAWGTYHFSGAPAVSWCGFARSILADRPDTEIVPIRTADFTARAPRPANSVLDCSRIAGAFGITQPDWREALSRLFGGR